MGRNRFRLAIIGCMLLLLASCRSYKIERHTERVADTLAAISVAERVSAHENVVFIRDTIEIKDSVVVIVNESGVVQGKKSKSNERNVRIVEKEVRDTVILADTVFVDREKEVYVVDEKEKKKNELSRNFMLGAGIVFSLSCCALAFISRK